MDESADLEKKFLPMLRDIWRPMAEEGYDISWDELGDRVGMGVSNDQDLEDEFIDLPRSTKMKLLKKAVS